MKIKKLGLPHWLLSSACALTLLTTGSAANAEDFLQNSRAENRCELTGQQQEMLRLVNEARSQARQCGTEYFPPAASLSWSCQLEVAAEGHAKTMAEYEYFSHTGLDGSKIQNRAEATGYRWRALGENIAAGQRTSSSVVLAWLESPSHCRNIMLDAFTEMGMAKVDNTQSRYLTYWAQAFGSAR
ncbi:CAP domain-containing protein [Halomonas sp. PAMB 3232]|uniref:CAP domain-containing protein n=1 Tax=Halomonas sp. PAMB 3232 TaxID=3075221 RepID=UPI0028A1C3D3|nr:CAP domain-containing protein [Halomonas sp. PAMB 3232]WNL40208.1 CAP domain-containing protein [Halomonas sp. PAMB 3232]